MKSIRKKIISSYLLVIFLTILICEILLITSVQKYYYNNAKDLLSNQIKLSADFYNTYLSSTGLRENVANDVDVFWKNTTSEVQIIDTSGKILMDSIGHYDFQLINSPDFTEALSGEMGIFFYKPQGSSETLLSVALPLKNGTENEGVLRFITSLKYVDKSINLISLYLILIGAFVIILSGMVSLLIANKITSPIEKITLGAKEMASGNFKDKITLASKDELGKLANTLNYMSEEILKNENLKNEFIASVSHELRTPLTSIKGWAIALSLCTPEDKEQFQDGLSIIEQESDRLTLLVDELLDFSKLISGKIVLNKDYIDLKDLLDNTEKQLLPRAQRENIRLSVNHCNPVPYILADGNRLKQLFMNILDNSLKFTSSGGEVKITTEVEKNMVKIIIQDTGCGIPEEDLPKVTEKFYKGKNVKSNNGIGLSICKEIVSLHKGSLHIKSEVNVGTEIIVKLPIEV
ncbi:signal transduction histidine-protein kinase BaeS [Clostridium homopropionicum DSM 5847]|uniref:histidine kinase n=1 Tax=Clostridium homopropionicum DSM 5847 TaxID=1121318 RepID=A0A0L6Z7K0_9CLOT|nr:signal transduction histidine-protein kinase BaeS [Clostridium homopropionicum DSM 5847]SFG43749.1 Signal transduction histidine kinase [Clostridium homopropionicum]